MKTFKTKQGIEPASAGLGASMITTTEISRPMNIKTVTVNSDAIVAFSIMLKLIVITVVRFGLSYSS